MECLIADCKKDVDLRIQDADEASKEAEDDKQAKMQFSIKGQETVKEITINTNVLQNKTSAVQIIKSIADSLGPAFFDWVDPMATLIVENLMVDHTSSQIRKTSTKILPVLMKCLSESSQMVSLLDRILPPML